MTVRSDQRPERFHKKDLLWALAYPLYQTIGTLRHEASHAVSAMLEGATVDKFVFWPTRGYWGYVRYAGPTTWVTTAAPYLVDLVTFAIFFVICTRLRFKRHWLWVNLVVFGLISPLVNSAYNYGRSFPQSNDVKLLLLFQSKFAVHAYFIVTLAIYAAGLLYLLLRGRVTLPPRPRPAAPA